MTQMSPFRVVSFFAKFYVFSFSFFAFREMAGDSRKIYYVRNVALSITYRLVPSMDGTDESFRIREFLHGLHGFVKPHRRNIFRSTIT